MPMPPCTFVGDIRQSSKYGKFEVIEYSSYKRVRIRFLETGYETWTASAEIRNGNIKDRFAPTVCNVGFIGGTQYHSHNQKKAYQTWVDMLKRCYKPGKNDSTYKDVVVCKKWLNFQTFCKWFLDNYIEGYELDKDLKIPGNKIYSAETCLMIPSTLNKALNRHVSSYESIESLKVCFPQFKQLIEDYLDGY